jgi:hypothetical protein
MSTWVKVAIDAWATTAGIADGLVFRSVNRGGEVRGTALSEKVVWQLIRPTPRPPACPESRPMIAAVMPNAGLCRIVAREPH